eukprot:PhF_6_TR18149/c0_g1_i1/m.26954
MSTMFQCQLVCEACCVVVGYELGAPAVRCPECTHISVVKQMKVTCPNCSTPVLFPPNTTSGLCPCCTAVMRFPIHTLFRPPPCRKPEQSSAPPRVVVFIETPKTLDSTGRERDSSTRIGIKMTTG